MGFEQTPRVKEPNKMSESEFKPPNPSKTATGILRTLISILFSFSPMDPMTDSYGQFVDELDATADALVAPWKASVASHQTWVELFFDATERHNIKEPTSLLELMCGFNIHRYIVPKLKGENVPQPLLQILLLAVSTGIRFKVKDDNSSFWGSPSPKIAETLLAEGADPNSELDKSNNSISQCDEIDISDKSVVSQTNLTLWTAVLQAFWASRDWHDRELSERLMLQECILGVMNHFLQNGADPTTEFYSEDDGVSIILKSVIRKVAADWLSDDNRLNDFPAIMAILGRETS